MKRNEFTGTRAARLAAALALACVVETSFSAQQPTFKSAVQIVEIDVRVFDRDGQFVGDLTREDFEVIEDGEPQRVDTFYVVRESGRAGAAPPPPAVPNPPGTAAPEAPPQTRQTWIFFFDINHLTPGGGFDRARSAVETFIKDRFREGDVGGILAGGKMVNNRLSSVRQELLEGLNQVKPSADRRNRWAELTREWPRLLNEEEAVRIARNERDAVQRAVIRACSDDPDQCRGTPPDLPVRDKAGRLTRDIQRASMETMTSINALANGLARIPGPKTVVFLSDGFPVIEVETTLRSVVGQTARAGARVYAIDVRGLGRVGAPDPGQLAAEDTAGAVTRFDDVADGPNSLAIDTGGMMIRNENNIGRALDTIAADANSFYVLGFQPTKSTWDGKFRAVQVRVKREGVRVRARKGYLAIEPARMLVPQKLDPTASEIRGAPLQPIPRDVGTLRVRDLHVVLPGEAVTTGRVVPNTDAGPAKMMRMRPDAATRVRELAGDTVAIADDAATIGWAAYQKGNVEAAIGPLQQAASAGNARPWVFYALGLSQAALGNTGEAIASWEQVRKAAPEFAPVYIDLAATYSYMADLAKALDVLRDAQKRWPNDPEIHNAVGVILVKRGAVDNAVEAFAEAVRVAPKDPLGYFNLGRAYEMRYARGGRFISSQKRWVMPDADRERAIDYYRHYVRLGGPYVNDANDALMRLEWIDK